MRSELEGFVLGLVWEMGPCSPYDLRRQMQASPSTQWSASAGAIYPLVRRLESEGLIQSRQQRRGRRTRREYEITTTGRRALKEWIGPPLAREAITVAHDPLRSRARFLWLLNQRERLAWIKAARAALDEVEQMVRAWKPANGAEAAAALMNLSGTLDVQSRREWIREIGKRA